MFFMSFFDIFKSSYETKKVRSNIINCFLQYLCIVNETEQMFNDRTNNLQVIFFVRRLFYNLIELKLFIYVEFLYL